MLASLAQARVLGVSITITGLAKASTGSVRSRLPGAALLASCQFTLPTCLPSLVGSMVLMNFSTDWPASALCSPWALLALAVSLKRPARSLALLSWATLSAASIWVDSALP